jgi:hypothetical protein
MLCSLAPSKTVSSTPQSLEASLSNFNVLACRHRWDSLARFGIGTVEKSLVSVRVGLAYLANGVA